MSEKTLYDNPLSGHAHRPRALLQLLQVDYNTKVVDLLNGEHKRQPYLDINPLGQVPAFVDGNFELRDSTAILVYLALVYDAERRWLPTDPRQAALVQGWLATSSKDIFEGPCKARLSHLLNAPYDHATAVQTSHALFKSLFEPHLAGRDWLVGDAPTIADIANYGYIAAAHEGDIDIGAYPNVSAWLRRLESVDGFVKMPAAADVLAGG